jgi:GTP-binding protein SAR1
MSFIWDWFTNVLSFLGLYSKHAKILFLGLDNAGKTTLLQLLKTGKVQQFEPTFHAGKEELQIGNVVFTAHDLGGHETARRVWETHFADVGGIIYLVDAADRERIPEAKTELDSLLSNPSLENVPFVVLGNKTDMREALSEQELRASLGLMQTTGKDVTSGLEGVRPLEIFMCSVARKAGYDKGFKWLSNFL